VSTNAFAYIDASAFVKLFGAEPESDSVIDLIDSSWPRLVASEILAVEACRAALRAGGDAPAKASRLLRRVVLRPLSPQVRDAACRVGPHGLRSLDAIHLATAISLEEKVGAIFTYDKRLAQASTDAGLRVLAPA
jgi:predicted nucleic acid-binding protein